MMKKLLQITALCAFAFTANAQSWNGNTSSWNYDLQGARKASLVTANGDVWGGTSSVASTGTAMAATPDWFPAPTGASTVIQARISGTTEAKYTLLRDGSNNIKSIQMDGSKGNLVNKFVARDIDNTIAKAAAKFSLRLKTYYTTANNMPTNTEGSVTLVYGYYKTGTGTSGEGSYFSDGNRMTASQITNFQEAAFAVVRLTYAAATPTFKAAVKKVTVATTTATMTDITNNVTLNVNNGNYLIDVYCNNNATGDKQYTLVGGSTPGTYTVAPGTFHLIIDGNKIGEYEAGVGLAAGKVLNAFAVDMNAIATDYGKATLEISDMQVSYTPETVLPVTLAGFTGSYHNNAVQLNWKTLSEKDNSHFEVLRSADGVTFNKIAKVQGQGSTATTVNYTATDRSPLNGVNYYQLKQIDNNGDYTLSSVIAVNVALSNNVLQTVNKEGALGVSYYSQNNSAIQVTVTDLNGHKLYNQKTVVNSGANSFDIPTALYIPGVYILSVKNDKGETQRAKFLSVQ